MIFILSIMKYLQIIWNRYLFSFPNKKKLLKSNIHQNWLDIGSLHGLQMIVKKFNKNNNFFIRF